MAIRQEKWMEARDALRMLSDTGQASSKDWLRLGFVDSRLGNYRAAIHSLHQVLNSSPNDIDALKLLAWLELRTFALRSAWNHALQVIRVKSCDG
jgi:hypothetical protein